MQDTMRVAIITSVHPPLDVRIFHKQAISLAQGGHKVALFAPFDPKARLFTENHGIRYFPIRVTKGRAGRPLRWWQLMNYLRSHETDIWHFHDPELLPLLVLWKKLFSRRVELIYDVHEDVPKDILDKPWIPALLRKPISVLADWIEKWGMRQCSLVIAATDSIARRAASTTQKVYTVHNYPLSNQVQFPKQPDNGKCPSQILYAGTIIEARGIREIVLAMNEIQDHQAELLLLGEFYPTSFESEIRSIAGANVKIVGKVPFDKMPEYFRSSDIGIVCFHPLPNHVEAMPNKLFEYMQAGLAVIASDFPLWRKIVEEAGSGILVDPLDPRSIANAIRRLIENPELCIRMGQAGIKAVTENYSWHSEAKVLLEAYQSLEID
jgi:glycosyltransferase involved in cell wall biosynthesis